MGVNQFTDLTHEEFVEKMLMNNIPKSTYVEASNLPVVDPPTEVDWRAKGKVTDVKNQGGCGSCWAFSTTGTLESALSIATGESNNFSEQQLVDCCGPKGYECLGCSGAWPEWAVNYINKEGIVQQKDYPYTGVFGTCQPVPTAKKFLNSARPWTIVTSTTESYDELRSAVSLAPVSVCLDASNWSTYRSGVFSNCGKTHLNHAVLLVGYSSDGVWLVKNSWGVTWGDNGYIRLAKGNTCGIGAHALTVNLA